MVQPRPHVLTKAEDSIVMKLDGKVSQRPGKNTLYTGEESIDEATPVNRTVSVGLILVEVCSLPTLLLLPFLSLVL